MDLGFGLETWGCVHYESCQVVNMVLIYFRDRDLGTINNKLVPQRQFLSQLHQKSSTPTTKIKLCDTTAESDNTQKRHSYMHKNPT